MAFQCSEAQLLGGVSVHAGGPEAQEHYTCWGLGCRSAGAPQQCLAEAWLHLQYIAHSLLSNCTISAWCRRLE